LYADALVKVLDIIVIIPASKPTRIINVAVRVLDIIQNYFWGGIKDITI